MPNTSLGALHVFSVMYVRIMQVGILLRIVKIKILGFNDIKLSKYIK